VGRRLAPTTVAIDSPCKGAPAGERSRPDEREFAAAGICRIRWTPELASLHGNPYYEWIEHGLEFYAELTARLPTARLIEVFPTAAWTVQAHRSRRRSSRGTTKSSNQSGTARCRPR
jgi:hypothetical protein